MPKLHVQKSSKQIRNRKAPPCGRIVKYGEPHSPFQKLIDRARLEHGLSGRALAKAAKIGFSNLYGWLHNESGYPSVRSFTPEILRRLASVLGLAPSEIEKALDASRHVFTPKQNPMPVEVRDAFRAFIEILGRDTRVHVKRTYVYNLARNLYNGATGEKIV